jgi:hypothetical protein
MSFSRNRIIAKEPQATVAIFLLTFRTFHTFTLLFSLAQARPHYFQKILVFPRGINSTTPQFFH